MLLPSGFKELYELSQNARTNEKGEIVLTAKDITQDFVSRGLTAGTAAGVIKRAGDQGVLEKIERGVYIFHQNAFDKVAGTEETVMRRAMDVSFAGAPDTIVDTASFVNLAIQECIGRINSHVNSDIEIEEFVKIKETIENLKNLQWKTEK